MGGLGHYLEQDGLATTQISLFRQHTERMRPPRALWVPFEFGRPFGAPGDAAFQTRVVMAALDLLTADEGPVLADFPDDAPDALDDDGSGWACPVNLAPPADETDRGGLLAALERERARLIPWYEMAVRKRGGTAVRSSGLAIEAIAEFITAFLDGPPPANPRPDVPLYDVLVFACDDLRAYYIEAVTAQPGRATSAELTDWFWRETTAAKVMWALRARCRDSDEDDMREAMYRFAPDDVVAGLGYDGPDVEST